jgi:uridine kinase
MNSSKLVLIGGGSASGKTYITLNALKALNDPSDFLLLSLDDYYKAFSEMTLEERKKQNFDSPDAFDWPLLKKQIRDLKNGIAVEKPVYDFNAFTRSDKVEHVEPKKVIILEGIMALESHSLRRIADLKIFVEASPERRIIRRLVRDSTERDNRTHDEIIAQYFATVKPMYDLYIEPLKVFSDAILYNEGTAESESKAVKLLTTLLKSLLID